MFKRILPLPGMVEDWHSRETGAADRAGTQRAERQPAASGQPSKE